MTDAEEHPFGERARAWIRRRAWWIVPALGVLYVLIWWLVPLLLYRHTDTDKTAKLEAITNTRTALLAGLIGVGALLTFWLNSRVYRATQEGQITDRYTKAIEQLGSTNLTIRLGGIYALERIAVDSKRDHPTVVEVLSAFVRESTEVILREPTPSPSTDVQAVLTVLGRLPQREGVSRGNLAGAQLHQVDLNYARLQGATLSVARLTKAHLIDAHLEEAVLLDTNLREASLIDAHLQGATLDRANLEGATLIGTHLERVDLSEVKGLTLEQLESARLDRATTKLPPGMQWAATEAADHAPSAAEDHPKSAEAEPLS